MGQKVNPISNRLGVIRGWDSNWFGGKKYGETLLEDSSFANTSMSAWPSRACRASLSNVHSN